MLLLSFLAELIIKKLIVMIQRCQDPQIFFPPTHLSLLVLQWGSDSTTSQFKSVQE